MATIDVQSWVIVILVAAGVTFIATPIVARVARATGYVVQPDERRVHRIPTPTLGGTAMLVGFLAAMGAAWVMEDFNVMFESDSEAFGIMVAAVLMWLVGFVDDLRDVSAPAKTAGMVLAGSAMAFAGVSIIWFRVPFYGLFLLTPDLSFLISVIWVMGMANAVNFIDGLDGLAAGIMAIAAGSFLLYSLRLGSEDVGLVLDSNIGPLVAASVLGICLGFLPHNIHPAKIFMGDCGALLLGVLMAASTISVGGRTDDPFSGQAFFFYAPLVIPLVILAVPMIDMLFAIVRRASSGAGLAEADIGHLHHRLMNLGLGPRRSVAILWAWTALLSGFVLYPTYTGEGDAIVPIGVAAFGLLLYTVLWGSRLRRRGDKRSANSDSPAEDGQAVPRP